MKLFNLISIVLLLACNSQRSSDKEIRDAQKTLDSFEVFTNYIQSLNDEWKMRNDTELFIVQYPDINDSTVLLSDTFFICKANKTSILYPPYLYGSILGQSYIKQYKLQQLPAMEAALKHLNDEMKQEFEKMNSDFKLLLPPDSIRQ